LTRIEHPWAYDTVVHGTTLQAWEMIKVTGLS